MSGSRTKAIRTVVTSTPLKPPERSDGKERRRTPLCGSGSGRTKTARSAALVEPINGRIHIEKINGPFLSKAGCNASGSEFGAGFKFAIEKGWLELHESGTYVRIKTPGEDPLAP